MTRVGWLLTALLCVLLGVGWYFLLFQPTSEEIEVVRTDTEATLDQAAQQRARADELRAVRQSAPEAEAALAAGQTLVPEGAAIPALFRQLQQAADDAGVRLNTLSPSAPSVETRNEQELAVIAVSMSVTGSYFQVVDLARRIEDPLLTPRALQWTSASLSPAEYPELSVTLSGQVFSRSVEELPTLETDEEDPADVDDGEGDPADPDDDDLDLEVEP